MRRTPLLLALLMALTACGQTGPLYLPEPAQDNAPPPAQPAPEDEDAAEASDPS